MTPNHALWILTGRMAALKAGLGSRGARVMPALSSSLDAAAAGRALRARKPLLPAGAYPLADQVALEGGQAREHGRRHPPLHGREIEGHARERDQRHAPALRISERAEKVGPAASPARQIGDEDGVDLAPLRQGKHARSFALIVCGCPV